MMGGTKIQKNRIQQDFDNLSSDLDKEDSSVESTKGTQEIGPFRKFINSIVDKFRAIKEFIHDRINSLFPPEAKPLLNVKEPTNKGIFERNVQPLKKSAFSLDDGATPPLQPILPLQPEQYFDTREAETPVVLSFENPGILSTANWSENAAIKDSSQIRENIAPPVVITRGDTQVAERSIGEVTFQQFFKLYEDAEASIQFSPGYFAFTLECLTYAHELANTAIGKMVDKMPNTTEIKASKALLEAERTIRHAQEQQAALETKRQEKLAEQEMEKTKLPGQTDFEEFFAMYERHKRDNTHLLIVENSKFLAEECMNYARGISKDLTFADQAKAAEFLSMWRASPAEALVQAKGSQDFQMPLPPAPPVVRRRLIEEAPPILKWESTVLDLQLLSNVVRSQLANIFSMRSEELEQALKGLRLAADYAVKPLIVAQISAQNYPAQLDMPPDSRQTDIDALQQAKRLLAKVRMEKAEGRLNGISELAALLESDQRIELVIDSRLDMLLPKRKQTNAIEAFKIPDVTNFSEKEMNAASNDFERFVAAFTNAGKDGRVYKIQPTSKYLDLAIVAIANSFIESVGKVQGLKLNDADTERMKAAGSLVNAAQRLATSKT